MAGYDDIPVIEVELPPFDAEIAASCIGKRILIGITYCDQHGKAFRQNQLHGLIVSATPEGVMIELDGLRAGQVWNMPPDFRSITPAQPGEYTLRETGEVVVNPDLIAKWIVEAPPIRH